MYMTFAYIVAVFALSIGRVWLKLVKDRNGMDLTEAEDI